MYINVHTLSGNLGADAVLRQTKNGPVLNFRMANTSPFGSKPTTWYTVSLFGKQAESLVSRLPKGTRVVVTGETQQEEYTAKTGETRTNIAIRANSVQLVDRAGTSFDADEVEEALDEELAF